MPQQEPCVEWLDYDTYVRWAEDYGITINGVTPAKTAGGGNGIVAARPLKAGEELLHVPTSALLSVQSIPKSLRTKLAGSTVHGLLAAFLTLGEGIQRFSPWINTFPTEDDFSACMPLWWSSKNESINNVLPPAISGTWLDLQIPSHPLDGLLAKQSAKLTKDFAHMQRTLSHVSLEAYRYHWMIVNTRSFFYDLLPGKKPSSGDDCMVLCPFADFFNHADEGCDVRFDEDGFHVLANKDYSAGLEVFTSYGSHSNDLLLAEYGFILEKNKWDNLPLDDLLADLLNDSTIAAMLDQRNYLGNYSLGRSGVCHRSQVAVRACTMQRDRWEKYVDGSLEETSTEAHKANEEIEKRILQRYYEEADRAEEGLEHAGDIPGDGKQVLKRRWKQIRNLIGDARSSMHVGH